MPSTFPCRVINCKFYNRSYNTSDMAWLFLIALVTCFVLVNSEEQQNEYGKAELPCYGPPNSCECLVDFCGKQAFQ